MIPKGKNWKWGPCGFSDSSLPRVIQPSIVVNPGSIRKKAKRAPTVSMSDAWTQTVHEELGCIETLDEDVIVHADIQSTINNQDEWFMWLNPDQSHLDLLEFVL